MPDPFDRLLERTMKAGARTAEPCPPADTLAAFVDGSLSAAERAAIERHAADCQLCAEHLALLSSLEPVSSSDLSMARAPWWRSWTWLVPVAASVVVAAVWVSLPRQVQLPTAEADRASSAARSAPEPPKPGAAPAAVPSAPAPSSPVLDRITPAPSALGGVAPKVRRQSVPAKAPAPPPVQSAPAAAGERRDQPPQMVAQLPASPPADSAAMKPQSADLKDKADEEQRQRSEAANIAREAVAAPAPPPTPAAPAGALSAARRGQAESAGFLAKSEGKKEAGELRSKPRMRRARVGGSRAARSSAAPMVPPGRTRTRLRW